MTSLAPLLKVQLLGAFGIGRLLNERSPRAKAKLGLAAAGIVLLAVLAAGYAGALGSALAAARATAALPALAVAVSGVGCVFSTFAKANGLLFGFKDFDLVVTMPAPLWAVTVSRVAPLYGMGLAFSLLLGGPFMAVWAVASGAGAVGVAEAALVLLLAPMIPVVLALAASFCVAWAASRTPFADRALGIVGLLAAIAIVVGVTLASGGMGASGMEETQELLLAGSSLEGAVTAFWPPAAWACAALGGDAFAFALYVGTSVAAGAAALAVLGRVLVPLNSLLSAGGARRTSASRRARASRRASGAATGAHRAKSPFAALVAKELRGWIATPIYLMNTAVGPVLALVAAAAVAAAGPQILASAANVPGVDRAQVAALMASAFPWVLAFCMALTPLSAASTSLEGSARWIAQTAPVPASALVGSKIAVNLIATVPAAVAAGAVSAAALAAGPADAVLCVAAPLSCGALSSCLGALLDARRPRFDWASAYEPVKRSSNVGICVGAGFVAVLAGGAATALAGAAAGIAAAAVFVAAAILAGRAALRIPLQDR